MSLSCLSSRDGGPLFPWARIAASEAGSERQYRHNDFRSRKSEQCTRKRKEGKLLLKPINPFLSYKKTNLG